MSLAPRTRLGAYEIRSPLGAGGMGEVYRARDERLGRDVAIKVLSAERTSDPERLKRFEKEARAASSLSHPNIVTIHEVQQSGATSFIVMELVEGKTLREVLAGGPLSVRTLLAISAQIADGLARAHASGIVHRDLKPENVMVTKEGLVKILDFGLAKLAQPEVDGGQPIDASTVTKPGLVMGTAGYMSPEQASGHPVDFRSDQFCLGTMLYEMVTGKQPFKRATVAQTLAAIIQEEPEPIAALNPKVPAPVRWIVERCLSKEARLRYASSEDLARELATVRDRIGEVSSDVSIGPASKRSRLLRSKVAAWTAAVTLLAAAAAVLLLQRPATTPSPRRYVSLVPPAGTEFNFQGGALVVSPDGQRIVFGASNAEGRTLLYLREFAGAEAHELPGTENPHFPFWSPDSRTVGFFNQEEQQADKLKRIGISDPAPVEICLVPWPGGGSWGADGVIVFGTLNGPLYRVPAAGGQPTAVTRLDSRRGEREHGWPHFLPDGRHFLFLASKFDGSLELEAGALDVANPKLLGKVESNIAYASPGYLLSVTADRTLVAEPFDAEGLRRPGGRILLADRVMKPGRVMAAFSVSRTGVLAYRTAFPPAPRKLGWFDRAGRQLETFGTEKEYQEIALSRDGTRLAVSARDPRTLSSDLWLYDFARGSTVRFTSDPASEGDPLWSPDGREIAFDSNRKGPSNLYVKSPGGMSPETPLLESDHIKFATDWSPDGRFLLYEDVEANGTWHLWALPMTGERKPFPVTQSAFREEAGRFSPDGRLIAYLSNESGLTTSIENANRNELYVQGFPQAVERRQVSAGGAGRPRWRSNGKELFYLSADNELMSVGIETRPVFAASAPRPLFRLSRSLDNATYEVAPDGQRFLFVISEREPPRPPPISLVFNWLPEGQR